MTGILVGGLRVVATLNQNGLSLFVPMAQWSKGGGRSDIEGHPDGMKHWEKQWREIGDRRLRKEGEGEKKSCMHLDERD